MLDVIFNTAKDILFGRSRAPLQTLNPIAWFYEAVLPHQRFEDWDRDYLMRMRIPDVEVGRIEMPVSYRVQCGLKGVGTGFAWGVLLLLMRDTPKSAMPLDPATIEQYSMYLPQRAANKDREIAPNGMPGEWVLSGPG